MKFPKKSPFIYPYFFWGLLLTLISFLPITLKGESFPATLTLSLQGALISSIEQNQNLLIKKLETQIASQEILAQKGEFDRLINLEISASDRLGKQIIQSGALNDQVSNRSDWLAGIEKKSVSGNTTHFSINQSRTRSARASNLFGTRIGLDLTFPLKKGRGEKVNLVSVKKASVDYLTSKEELQGFLLNLVAQVETRYWDYFLAGRELEVFQKSLELAIRQFQNTLATIRIGNLSESELAAASAEVALSEEALINAQFRKETARVNLLRLVNSHSQQFWQFNLQIDNQLPTAEIINLKPENYISSGLTNRPEIKTSRLMIQRGELVLIETKNGLLPKLDFFINLGRTGYAESFSDTFKGFKEKAYDISGGLVYQFPTNNRIARADHKIAQINQTRNQEGLDNLIRGISEEILQSFFEAQRAFQQISATSKTVLKQQEKLRAEEIKFQHGKTTSFLVAQAQRDAAESLINELKARLGYLKALTELYRLDGSLLKRRGLTTQN